MSEAKRETLKQKVAAGQARNKKRTENTTTVLDRAGEAAIEAKDRFTQFAKDHPITTVAGGVALGILIAGMFKGPRRAAMRGGTKAAGLAAIGAELALGYAQQAMAAAAEAGRAGAERLDGLGDTARDLGRDAADRAGNLGESAKVAARGTGKRIAQAWRDRTN